MNKRLFFSTIIFLILCLMLNSCTPNVSSKNKDTIQIGISMMRFNDVFLTYLRESMERTAAVIGNIEFTTLDSKGDVGTQLSQVENFVNQGMDVIIVNAADTEATAKITKIAVDADIPIIYVNRKPSEKLPMKAYFVGSNEVAAGKIQMKYLAKLMKGKGNLAIMLGDIGGVATRERTRGVKEVLQKYPNIHLVEEQSANMYRDEALDLMNNWLSSGKKIDAVAANNDEMALGAILAIKNIGLKPNKDILVGGVDATPDAMNAMRKGDLTVTVFQDAKEQGKAAIETACRLIKGEPVSNIVWIPFELVTQKNYKDFIN
jgi:inositol transport system substrate-binding protein